MVDDESESFVAINNHLYDILERKLLAVPGNVSDVCVSKSTEEIADFVYAHCCNLKTAIIPNHVRNIGKEAFASCPNLQRVVIESGVEAIGKHAFSNCGTLKHVVIPATVSFIGEHAFKDCGSKLVIDTPYNTYAWNYAKKSGISLVQKEPLHNGKVNCDNVYQILEDIHNMVSQTNSRTVRIEDKLDGLVDYIENDLNSFIASKKLRHEPTDKDKKDVSEFVESTVAYINQTMTSPDVLVEHETKHLQLLFGKSWDRLLPTSRTSLVSAGVLWKSCASITKDNFDFSGVCISATSALEAELKRVFYTGFQNFLEARYGKPDANNWESTFVNWPEKLLSCTRYDFKKSLDKYSRGDQKWKPTIEKGNSFTMGVLPFIFGKPEKFRNPDQERLLHTRLEEYLATIVTAACSVNPIQAFYKDKGCFVEKSESVRKDYRNKAAHVDVVSRAQAEGCYQQVIGKMDAYEYTSDVTGLIIELYDRLR